MASKKYLDKDFKMNAVRIMNEGLPVAKIARDLEVSAKLKKAACFSLFLVSSILTGVHKKVRERL